MPKYVVERDITADGVRSAEQTRKAAEKVLCEMGSEIQWVTSYVTGDKPYWASIAPGPQLIGSTRPRGVFP